MSNVVSISQSWLRGIIGMAECSMRVEGFRAAFPLNMTTDGSVRYLEHSVYPGMLITVPWNLQEKEGVVCGGTPGGVLCARGVTTIRYEGILLASIEDLALCGWGHVELFHLLSLLLEWHNTGKTPREVRSSSKETTWEAIAEMVWDDPEYCMGELVLSGSPLIVNTIVKHMPRRSKEAAALYLSCMKEFSAKK